MPAFSYPKGKKDPKETEVDCAIREVGEETGFNMVGLFDPAELGHPPKITRKIS